jgi:uncharacterized protein YciI
MLNCGAQSARGAAGEATQGIGNQLAKNKTAVLSCDMFIISLNYLVSLEQIDAHMKPHMTFLKKHYDDGTFIMSGRKVPRTGGIILALAKSQEELQSIVEEDPFVKLNLAEYSITEFQTSQIHPDLKKALGGLSK